MEGSVRQDKNPIPKREFVLQHGTEADSALESWIPLFSTVIFISNKPAICACQRPAVDPQYPANKCAETWGVWGDVGVRQDNSKTKHSPFRCPGRCPTLLSWAPA
jgi:hypothetical protein